MTERAARPRALRGRAPHVFLVSVLLLASCSLLFRGSVPQREGTLALSGLLAPVTIVRDAYGVPHITAENEHDLYFAQGVVHAQDRLFQMDAERRLARGELAELLGREALPADRFLRHLGFAARAPVLFASWPEETQAVVRAYCDGINAARDALRAWPAEHRLLRTAPRPFVPEDLAALLLLKAFGLSQWADETLLYRLAQRLPADKMEEIMPQVPAEGPDGPAAVPGADAALAGMPPFPALLAEGLASVGNIAGGLAPPSSGSNAWAVSGGRSGTGRPILASDPHLMLPCPSPWYEVHLVAPGLDVYGVSFPGSPGVVIGHNPRIAWGLTNAMLDDADFFIERIDGEKVMSRGKWVPMTTRVETIRVRDEAEEVVPVRETPRGPILSPVLPGIPSALSLRWVGYDGGDPLGALLRLGRAQDREEVLAALSLYPFPAQNVVYADDAGHIGLVLAGRIPIRKGGGSLLPVPGDTGEWDWTGYVPFSGNPRITDPPEGFLVAANAPVAEPGYRHYISRIYDPPDRARRIAEVLRSRDRHSVEDFERLQSDVMRPDAAEAVALALRAARAHGGDSPALAEAARILSGWDLRLAADSAGAALFEAFYRSLVENVFRDDLGDDLFAAFYGSPRLVWNAMDRILARGDSLFLEDPATGRRESLEEVAARSLEEAAAFLSRRLGDDAAQWSWGRIHQVAFEHPFGRNRYLRRWFTLGPYAIGGDGRTVFKGEFRRADDFSVQVGQSMRQVVPLGFRRLARSVVTTGASGHFFERHYRDQAPLWLAGKSHPAWTDPEDIAANAEATLRLVPSRPERVP
jgi:penicillin G amidase